MVDKSGGRNKEHNIWHGYIWPSPDIEEMTLKLHCHFHGFVFHSTPAHQEQTAAWGATVSSGHAQFLGIPCPYCRIKVQEFVLSRGCLLGALLHLWLLALRLKQFVPADLVQDSWSDGDAWGMVFCSPVCSPSSWGCRTVLNILWLPCALFCLIR